MGDYTFVANVVEANLLACRAEGVGGEVFNIACGERHTLLDLVSGLEGLLGKQARPEFAPPRLGEIKHSQAAIDKAWSRLGYTPVVSFEDGLGRVVGFFESKTGS